jgi:glycosyltransferase involved in cell wall biosynthesis
MSVDPFVSIIMPVYNAKDYIGKAIESVLHQSYKNFELIIIDDGASDGSELLCDQYAEVDTRIKLIHQENRGICSARNRGLKLARGKYISFCDHDDIYFPDYLMKSVIKAEKLQVPLVKFGHKSEYWKDQKLIKIVEEKVPDRCIHVSELSKDYPLLNLTIRALWNGLYLRKMIVDNNIFFNEEILSGMEDFLFNITVLRHITTVAYMPDVLFLHFGRSGQSTSLKYSEKRFRDIMTVQREEGKWLSSHNPHPKVVMQHRRKYLNLFSENLVHSDCPLSVRKRLQLIKELRNSDEISDKGTLLISLSEILKHPRMGIKDTLYCLRMYGIVILGWKFHPSRWINKS